MAMDLDFGLPWLKEAFRISIHDIGEKLDQLLKEPVDPQIVLSIENEIKTMRGVLLFLEQEKSAFLLDEIFYQFQFSLKQPLDKRKPLLELMSSVLIRFFVFFDHIFSKEINLSFVVYIDQLRGSIGRDCLSVEELNKMEVSSDLMNTVSEIFSMHGEYYENESDVDFLRKMKVVCQRCWASLLRNENEKENLLVILKVFRELLKINSKNKLFFNFGVCLIDLISIDLVSLDSEAKKIIGSLIKLIDGEYDYGSSDLLDRIFYVFISALSSNESDKNNLELVRSALESILDSRLLFYLFSDKEAYLSEDSSAIYKNLVEDLVRIRSFVDGLSRADPSALSVFMDWQSVFVDVSKVLDGMGFEYIGNILLGCSRQIFNKTPESLLKEEALLKEMSHKLIAMECYFLGMSCGLFKKKIDQAIDLDEGALEGVLLFARQSILDGLLSALESIKSVFVLNENVSSESKSELMADDSLNQSVECVLNNLRMIKGIAYFFGLDSLSKILNQLIDKLNPYSDSVIHCFSGRALLLIAECLSAIQFYFEWCQLSGNMALDKKLFSIVSEDLLLLDESLLKPVQSDVDSSRLKNNNAVQSENLNSPTKEDIIDFYNKCFFDIRENVKIWVRDDSEVALKSVYNCCQLMYKNSVKFKENLIKDISAIAEDFFGDLLQSRVKVNAAIIMWIERFKDQLKMAIDDAAKGVVADRSVDWLSDEARKLKIKINRQDDGGVPLGHWVFDQTVLNIFSDEALYCLDRISYVVESHHINPEVSDLYYYIYRLLEISKVVNASSLLEITIPVLNFIKFSEFFRKRVGHEFFEFLGEFSLAVKSKTKKLTKGDLLSFEEKEVFLERIKNLSLDIFGDKISKDMTIPVKDFFVEKRGLIDFFSDISFRNLMTAFYEIQSWHFKGVKVEIIDNLINDLLSISVASKKLKFNTICQLSDALIDYLERLKLGVASDAALFQSGYAVFDGLLRALDQLAAGLLLESADHLVEPLVAILNLQMDSLFLEDDVPIDHLDWSDDELIHAQYDEDLVNIFLDEATDLVATALVTLQRWVVAPQELLLAEELYRDMHTLKGGARLAGIRPIELIAYQLTSLYEGVCDNRIKISEELLDLMMDAHDILSSQIASLKNNAACHIEKSIYLRIQQVVDQMSPRGLKQDYIANLLLENSHSVADEEGTMQVATHSENTVDLLSEDVMDIFIEEADDLLFQLSEQIEIWPSHPKQERYNLDIQRILHTLKGGARLTGVADLANASHEFEQFLIEFSEKHGERDSHFFAELHHRKDKLVELFNIFKDASYSHKNYSPTVNQQVQTSLDSTSRLHPASDDVEVWLSHQKDMIKLPADLLDKCVHISAESSLVRGRVEQQINECYHVTHEMDYSLIRIRELLKKLEIEDELKQNSLNNNKESHQYSEFNAMEIDRYSNLYHISRSLSEALSDLFVLKENLIDKYRDTESLLIQQSRLSTDLQDKLLQIRMVPFSRLIPRLRRLVKQVSDDLNKKIQFEFVGVEDRLDRTLLERMVIPLEHMLRNAIDHGIETPEERVALGKPEQGRITLLLAREGQEIVLRLSDDGRGIDVDQIRQIAIKKGLIDQGAQLTDHDVLQFIFKSGFSTRSEVTQISGRGIGMDVVYSEIKQVGGAMKIHSAPNVGTQFSIRLPFTVSLNKALMVKMGEDTYAIPLSHVEGVIRLSADELESAYQNKKLLYNNKNYQLKYLGLYVHGKSMPENKNTLSAMPVLLVRGGDHPVALQVDSILGSKEVVVQSVGPQLSSVSGISGAAVLGDGSVVIILDLIALLRAERASTKKVIQHPNSVSLESSILSPVRNVMTPVVEGPKVLVVDDSMTVRKVMQRLLTRHGITVVVAKDGMEAMTLLRHEKPDLALIDVEMPRMDGFELVSWIRQEEILKDLPVIMVTSRVGEKHKNRAMQLKVIEYLGKPFQEDQLLALIQSTLKYYLKFSHE